MASYNISITGKRRSQNNVRRPSAAVKRTSTLGSEDQKEEEEESRVNFSSTSTGDIQLAMYGGETAYTSSSKKTQDDQNGEDTASVTSANSSNDSNDEGQVQQQQQQQQQQQPHGTERKNLARRSVSGRSTNNNDSNMSDELARPFSFRLGTNKSTLMTHQQSLNTWIDGEQPIGGRNSFNNNNGPEDGEDEVRIGLEDVRPSKCLYFTPKYYKGCCCCTTRILSLGDVILFRTALLENTQDAMGDELQDNDNYETAEIQLEGSIVHLHYDTTLDLLTDDGYLYERVPRNKIVTIYDRSTDEVHTMCGCVFLKRIELEWDNFQSKRAKIRFRVGAVFFVFINMILCVLDDQLRYKATTASVASSTDQLWQKGDDLRAVQWVTAPYYNTSSYNNNPFCANGVSETAAVVVNNQTNLHEKEAQSPVEVSNILVAMRCIGIILPSLLLVLFSWMNIYSKSLMKRNALTYSLSFLIACAVGFISGYKFSFWYELAHIRRGIPVMHVYPRIPGQGMMLYYMAFAMCYTPLPTMVSVTITSFSLLIWFASSMYQLTTAPLYLSISNAVSVVALEFLLLSLLMMLCFFQNWYRENYARWDYLQKEILQIQKKSLLENQRTASRLLQSMLPRTIIEQLKSGQPVMAEMYNPVTVLFAEICQFSKICEHVSPQETVLILNEIYTVWDKITDQHQVYKVETVGEVYMAVSGCPVRIVNHAHVASACALDMIQSMSSIRKRLASLFDLDGQHDKLYLFDTENTTTPTLDAHIGLNTGRINAGVVGTNNPRFKLFGDTVNMASRMESTCPHGRIQCSRLTYHWIQNDFLLEDRGLVQVKGKGEQQTWYLNDFLPGTEPDKRRITPILKKDNRIQVAVNENQQHEEEKVTLDHSPGDGSATTIPTTTDVTSTSTATTATIITAASLSSANTGTVATEKQRRKTFWSEERMKIAPRMKLKAWARRARKSVHNEKMKWRGEKKDEAATGGRGERGGRGETKGGNSTITAQLTTTTSPTPAPTLSSPLKSSSSSPRSISSRSGGVGKGKKLRSLTSTDTNSTHTTHTTHTTHSNSNKKNAVRRGSYFGGVSKGLLGVVAEEEANKSQKTQLNELRRFSSRGKIEGISAITNMIDSSSSNGRVRRDLSSSVRQDSRKRESTTATAGIEESDQMLGITAIPPPRKIYMHENNNNGNSGGTNATSRARNDRNSNRNISRNDGCLRSLTSYCGKIFWPELDQSPSSRLMYRMMRCLSITEMRDINFDQLQQNSNKFKRFQHTKYYRSTVLILLMYAIGFSAMTWYDLYQFLPFYINAQNSQTYQSDQWKIVDRIFFRVVIRTGAIGTMFMLMLFMTLYNRRIPWKTHLFILLLIGGFVVVLCFETGCHGDNTYFVMFSCAVYLLMGLPVYGRLFVLTVVALAYMISGLALKRLSPAGVTDLALILFSLILMSFPQLQQQHYERLNHTQSIELVKSRKHQSRESKHLLKLLSKLLPLSIIQELASGRDLIADPFDDVTIIFTDMKGFTAFSSQIPPSELVNFLNTLYSAFDEILDQYGLYKVEVIGDAYYVVSGAPVVRTPDDNAERCVDASMAMLRTIPRVCEDTSVQIRVGIHSGSVIAGVVGVKDPRYHLFGPTVTTAMQMESHGIPSKVHVSQAVVDRLATGHKKYKMESRGNTALVPGQKETFIILSKDRSQSKRNGSSKTTVKIVENKNMETIVVLTESSLRKRKQ